jgi:hypothetical protein
MEQRKPPCAPWNNWYHCMFHTYGAWLPGDHRGFRTRHHKKHIEGDYNHPPEEDFSALHASPSPFHRRSTHYSS